MRLLEVIRQFAERGAARVKGLAAKAAEFLQPRQKLGLICLSACMVLVLLLLVSLILGMRRNARPARPEQSLSEAFSPRAIPPEELFLPDEPDFVPAVILERERREAWTAEDARPFWTDPLDEGAEGYVNLMSKVIDDLMERTP
jgi:hypothetical protein